MGFSSSKPGDTFNKKPEGKKVYLPLPDGVHKFAIIESEYEEDEKSKRFVMTLQVDDDASDFNRSRVWARFPVESDSYSPVALRIGQEGMDKIGFAAGVYEEGDEVPEDYADRSDLAHKFIGQSVYALTGQRTYNDKVYVDAKDFWTIEGEHLHGKVLPAEAPKKKAKEVKAPLAKPVKPKFG
jgi:hypothetical protein